MEINAIQFFTQIRVKILFEECLQIYLYPAVSKVNRGSWLPVSTIMQILFLPYGYRNIFLKYEIIIYTPNFIEKKKGGRGVGTVKC